MIDTTSLYIFVVHPNNKETSQIVKAWTWTLDGIIFDSF